MFVSKNLSFIKCTIQSMAQSHTSWRLFEGGAADDLGVGLAAEGGGERAAGARRQLLPVLPAPLTLVPLLATLNVLPHLKVHLVRFPGKREVAEGSHLEE